MGAVSRSGSEFCDDEQSGINDDDGKESVKAIKEAAMSGEEGSGVLDLVSSFQSAFKEVPALRYDGKQEGYRECAVVSGQGQEALGSDFDVEGAQKVGQVERNEHGAGESAEGARERLVGGYGGPDFWAADGFTGEIGEGVGRDDETEERKPQEPGIGPGQQGHADGAECEVQDQCGG